MRTLCDVCETAAAILFCAADEAALCRSCDDKVHKCNKLANRHVRVGLASPIDVPRCDICENAPDGSSLCLQCDMAVHVGGKRTHGRYLLWRQRVEFPGDKPTHTEEPVTHPMGPGQNKREYSQPYRLMDGDNQQNHNFHSLPNSDAIADGHAKIETEMIDLNMKPHRLHGQPSNNQNSVKQVGKESRAKPSQPLFCMFLIVILASIIFKTLLAFIFRGLPNE